MGAHGYFVRFAGKDRGMHYQGITGVETFCWEGMSVINWPWCMFSSFPPFSAGKASMMWAGVVDCVLLRIERMCIPLTTCDLFSPFLLVSCYLHKATLCLTLQLTFAWSINGISSSSGPHLKFPYPSPRSTLMCTLRPIGAILIGKEMLKTVEHNEFTSKERIAG